MIRSSLALTILFAAAGGLAIVASPVAAQSQGQNGYAARLLDGRNVLGEHFAVAPRIGGNDWQAFHYLEDEQALFTGSCSTSCRPATRLTTGADQGRFVSAAARLALPGGRPFAAFYNATSGDLEGVDCLDSSCNFATLRVLDTNGDVGAGTATAVDAITGFPLVAYYDAGNGDLRLYRCSTNDCSTGSSVLVDGTGDRGRNPALVVNAGVATLVYDDSSSGELRVATAAAPYDVFTRTRVAAGRDAALTLTATGIADIVFTGPTQALERRRCITSACIAFESPGALTATAGTGIAPSATRLPNGNLFVAHRDDTSGDMLGTVCNNADCDAPMPLLLEAGPGMGESSVALAFSDGRPLAVFRDAAESQLRSAQCTTVACTTILRRIAGNGLYASSPDVATRADGRAIAIWTRLRAPRIGMCVDAACSSIDYRTPDSGNSDGSKPSIAVRQDGRPFAFYSYFGGNAAWDCADTQCDSGTLRQVGGTGNATGNITELAIRPDGRPVMLYYRATTNDVLLFSCADVDCTSGTERLVADEPTTQSTSLSGLALAVGADNRPRVVYNANFQPTPGVFAGELRLARCADIECTSASVTALNAEQGFYATPLAIRSDNRPVMVENAGANRNLLTCEDADCATRTRVALPNPFDIPGPMGLRDGNVVVFGSGTLGTGGYWDCNGVDCTAPERVATILDTTTPNRGFTSRLALDADEEPVLVFEEQDLGDVWLSVLQPIDVFADGFEN
jgi:hypothetical protein